MQFELSNNATGGTYEQSVSAINRRSIVRRWNSGGLVAEETRRPRPLIVIKCHYPGLLRLRLWNSLLPLFLLLLGARCFPLCLPLRIPPATIAFRGLLLFRGLFFDICSAFRPLFLFLVILGLDNLSLSLAFAGGEG